MINKEKYLGKLDIESPDVKQRLGKGKNLTHISLFTGIGGFDIGFAKAGIKTRVMVEFDKYCCQTLRANFFWEGLKQRKENGKLVWKNKSQMKKSIKWYHYPEPVLLERDITKLTTEEILKAGNLEVGECSVISGGFPCQGFSLAGERMINDPRNALYKEFVRIVNEAKPAMFIGENVPGIVSMGKGVVIKQICEDFANCGYDIAWKILNAADFGVPQHRKRVFLIGHRVDLMRLNKGKSSYHLGACSGTNTHHYLLKERLQRWKNKELLEEMEKDPQINFMEKEK